VDEENNGNMGMDDVWLRCALFPIDRYTTFCHTMTTIEWKHLIKVKQVSYMEKIENTVGILWTT